MTKTKIKHYLYLLRKQKLIYIICCFLFWCCGNNGNSARKVLDIENQIIENGIEEKEQKRLIERYFTGFITIFFLTLRVRN
jgi:hypothetical protein